MKKYILAFALLIGMASFNNQIEAQNINISINIGNQPAWGPVGYDYVGYYYFPAIDCYYDVNLQLFYFLDRGRWISARYLPYAYRHYDLYNMYKVVLNVNNPWRYHTVHRRDYARYRNYRASQPVIRDSRDYRYRDSRNNRVAWYSDKKANNRTNNNSIIQNNNKMNNNSRPSTNINSNRNRTNPERTVNSNRSPRNNNKETTTRKNSNIKSNNSRQSNTANYQSVSGRSSQRAGARSNSR